MTQPTTAPFGTWKSPITAELIVANTLRLGEIRLEDEVIYWNELRPSEGGRSVVVRCYAAGAAPEITDVTPAPFNVRTRVHEYGGGAYLVDQGIVYFSNFQDQRLYRQSPGEAPTPLTPEAPLRYADGVIDRQRQRLICVQEDHRGDEVVNAIAAIPLNQSEPTILAQSSDFYAAPRLSPDGSQLAWVSWNHPNMPWDGTELWLADITANGQLRNLQQIAGGPTESIFQPEWSPGGILHYIGDATGWWNLYRWRGESEPLCPMAAEFGLPQWVFGLSTYAFESERSLLCTYRQDGVQHFSRLDTETRSLTPIETPYDQIGGLQVSAGAAVFIGAVATRPSAIVRLDLATGEIQELRRTSQLDIDPSYMTEPESITFPTTDGLSAHGIYYPPKNNDYQAPAGKRPPLLVKTHGGPTAATSNAFNPGIQYWTSRGIAVLDVNYGGSTGYGREYRERLKGRWGIVDVDDCVNGALYLIEQGKADRDRLAIDGGSAGGYTTLAALTFRDVFKAGASYYGVSNMASLAEETHKFESRYLDSLVGPYPERRDLYEARSPINHVDQLSCPVIFLQGNEDKIVPPNQAELMVEALRAKGIPVAYVLFEGEQHGFRKAENIKRALDAELFFYAQVFGFSPADKIEPVEIRGLSSSS